MSRCSTLGKGSQSTFAEERGSDVTELGEHGTDPGVVSPPRYFYGWVIVVGAIIGQFAAAGGQGQVSGVMLRPMVDELGWTVGQFTIATSAAFIAGGIAGLVIGPMVDRYGSRPLMIVGAFAYSGSLLLTSQVTAVWQFIVLQVLTGGIGASLVGPLVVNVTVSRWFVLRRGWAISIGSMGISFAALIMPPAITAIVDSTDWRTGYVALAGLVFVLLIGIAPFMRSRPEDYGMLPDGRDPNAEETVAEQQALAKIRSDLEESLTRSEALRTRSMWLLIVAFGLNMAGLTAMFVHGIPFMTESGFSRTEASLAFSVTGAANFASKFIWGWGCSASRRGTWPPALLRVQRPAFC